MSLLRVTRIASCMSEFAFLDCRLITVVRFALWDQGKHLNVETFSTISFFDCRVWASMIIDFQTNEYTQEVSFHKDVRRQKDIIGDGWRVGLKWQEEWIEHLPVSSTTKRADCLSPECSASHYCWINCAFSFAHEQYVRVWVGTLRALNITWNLLVSLEVFLSFPLTTESLQKIYVRI